MAEQVLELGQGDYIIIESRQIDDKSYSIELDDSLILKKADKLLLFQDRKDFIKYLDFEQSADRFKPRHVFYNLNKYGNKLLPNQSDDILKSLYDECNCSASNGTLSNIKRVIDYADRQTRPVAFYRKYIAEFTLMIYLFFLEGFPNISYDLIVEDNTYIPYLTHGDRRMFPLAALIDDLFANGNWHYVKEHIEIAYSRLER